MGGAASSPEYAKIYVDVVNRESTEAGASRVGLVLPVDSGVFAAVQRLSAPRGKRKRRRAGDDVDDDVTAFVNNGARLHAVTDYFSVYFRDGVRAVLGDLMSSGIFPHIGLGVTLGMELTGNAREPRLDLNKAFDRMAMKLMNGMEEGESVTIPFSLEIRESGSGHANTGVIKYNAATRDLLVLLFEPHAKRWTRLNEIVTQALTDAMNVVLMMHHRAHGGERITLRVVSPHSEFGLQGSDTLCVVWSILMLLVYLLNCEAVREKRCSFGRVQGVMDMLWHRRRHIMPAWLYTLQAYVPGDAQPVFPYQPPSGVRETALDAAQCSDRAPGVCTHPCTVDETGACYNAGIFSVKRRK